MKTYAKKIITFLLAIIVLLTTVHGDSYADAMSEIAKAMSNYLSKYENISGSGVGSTGYVEKGVNDSNQGWIIYGINKYGQVIAEPYIIGSGYEGCNVKQLTTRYESKEPSKTANITIPKSFYFNSSYAGISNWENVRNYVWQNIDSILNLWGGEFKESFSEEKKNEYETYLILEPFYWHGLHKKGAGDITLKYTGEEIKKIVDDFVKQMWDLYYTTHKKEWTLIENNIRSGMSAALYSSYKLKGATYVYSGTMYCGTVYNGANYEDTHPGVFVGVHDYRHGGYATFCKYSQALKAGPEVAAATKTSSISNSDIRAAGYGIAAFSNKGPDPDVPDTPGDEPEDDGYNPLSLYETKNYDHTNTYDISEAIPSSEYLTNEINVASFVGDGNFITTKEQNSSRTWTATCNYYYTVHDWYHINDTWEAESLVATVESEAAAKGYNSSQYRYSSVGTVKNPQYKVYRKAHWHYGDTQRKDIDAYNTYTYPIVTNTYAFSASLKYQYINQTPHVYTWKDTTVTNGSYGQAFYDKINSKMPAEVKAVATLWNNGNGKSTLVTSSEAYPSVAYKGSSDHYSWSGNISNISCNVATLNKGYNHSDETANFNKSQAVSNHEQSQVQRLASQIQNQTKSRNDSLKINAKKIGDQTALDDSWVTGCTVYAYRGSTPTGSASWTFGGADAASSKGYKGLFESINDGLKAGRVTGKQVLQIPDEKNNGDYTTGMTVNWVNIFDDTTIYTQSAGATVGSSESIYKHVMRDGVLPHHTGTLGGAEADGYPVRVHTPVESPIKIVDSLQNEVYEKTQLINGSSLNDTVDNQLLLDKQYYLMWDNEQWISAVYGETPSGYENIFDKYVTAKYMQFPFSVVYNNKLYQTDATGYTEWIEVLKPDDVSRPWTYGANRDNYESANHWQMTPFYIPTFASECGAPNDDKWVNVKVSAINVGQRLGPKDTKVYMADVEHSINDLKNTDIDGSLSQNSDKANYVAICDKKVQLSGWVYDFSIVGTTNLAVYTGEGLEDIDLYKNIWPMARDKMELKTGLKNRLGNNYLRFLIDGTVTNTLDERQLLPFRDGSSYKFNKMGAIWRGQDFAFTIKTIANLDRMTDSIDITPTYTYVKEDGTVISGDNLCYVEIDKYAVDTPDDNDTVKSLVFHAYDKNDTSTTSKWNYKYKLSDRMFNESYYDDGDVTSYHYADWVKRSVDNENEKNGAVLFGSTVDEGEYMNREVGTWSISHIHLPAEARYISGEYEQLERNEGLSGNALNKYSFSGYNAVAEELFKKSMQQWNGQFGVPLNIRLMDTTGKTNFDIYEYLEELTNTNGYFSWDDAPFEPLKGTLIIGFDITVNKAFCEELGVFCEYGKDYSGYTITSRPYLTYSGAGGGGRNMWETEEHRKDPSVPYDEDDVVIVDLSRSMNDYFEIGLLNIN